MSDEELRRVVQRYARRAAADPEAGRYSPLRPEVWQMMQERQRAMLKLFVALGWRRLDRLRLTEVGCGAGDNLLELLRLGFAPQHLGGIELLPERHAQACHRLPGAALLHLGDACVAPVAPESQDIVLQSTVFSSLLDDPLQRELADAMWRWVRPGGGVLWYDFVFNNPRNHDVRGVPVARLRELFPRARLRLQRVTLAPPLARACSAVHPALYTVFNTLPWLRTHVLAWLQK